jgi:hypothetical protein
MGPNTTSERGGRAKTRITAARVMLETEINNWRAADMMMSDKYLGHTDENGRWLMTGLYER